MALQVRLRHALGEKLLELPEREISEPLLIGRASQADVQVPSIGVSPQHCALFVHEGRWAVQPIHGTTTLNGSPLTAPAPLLIGDVIGIGADGWATLEIDPAGAAQGNNGPAIIQGPLSAEPDASEVQPVEEATEGSGWGLGNAAWQPGVRTRRYRARKGKQGGGGALAFSILFAIAAFGGVGLYLYMRRAPEPVRPPPLVIKQQPGTSYDTPPQDDESSHLHSMFDFGKDTSGPKQAVPATAPSADPVAGTDSTVAQDADTVSRPQRQSSGGADPAWDDVVAAHLQVREQGPAVVKFDEYRRLHPGRHDAALDAYTEQAADMLYWQRIDSLWRKRDRLTGQLQKVENDLRAQPPGSFHDLLLNQKNDLLAQRAKVQQGLTGEMGFTGNAPPDPDAFTFSKLPQMQNQRDPAKYARFKDWILHYVRDHHGEVPWAGET